MFQKNSLIASMVTIGVMLLVSALLLMGLAAIIWKVDLGSGFISGSVVGVYVIVCVLGGFIEGIRRGTQKFFWGFVIGILYFMVLLGFGTIIFHSEPFSVRDMIAGGIVCSVSGMFGGMVAPAGRGDSWKLIRK